MRHKRELTEVQQLVLQGIQDLYYFDEAGFSLTPSVPYGWQPVGERIQIPSSRSAQLNVLGFLGYHGEAFDSYVFQGAIDASIAIACINSFAAKITRPTTLVIDNAPIHTSTEFQLMIPKWECQNLSLWFLPPYSPELNLIEILWKKIKYDWLPLEAYESFGHLKEILAQVLANIGKEFKICFQ